MNVNDMTSAQKQWINSGNKKRPLEETSEVSRLNPVNFKNKNRKYAPQETIPEMPWAQDDGEFIQKRDNQMDDRENQ